MKLVEFLEKVASVFSNVEIHELEDGELIIHTGLKVEDDEVVPLPEIEDNIIYLYSHEKFIKTHPEIVQQILDGAVFEEEGDE